MLLLLNIMTFVSALIILVYVYFGIVVSYFVWNYCRRIFFVKKEIIQLPSVKLHKYKNFLRGTPDEILEIFNLLMRHYPSPFQTKLYYLSFIIIYEPDQVKTVLQNQHCLDKGILYKFAKPMIGMGLLTAPASIWSQSRKIISPSFDPIMMEEFFDTLVEQSLILTDELEKVGLNGNNIIFLEHASRCAVDIICGAIGIKMESNNKDQYLTAFTRFMDIFKYRTYFTFINNYLFYDVIFTLTTLGREQQKILKSLHSLTNKMIEQQHKLNKLHTIKTNTSHKTFFGILMEKFFKKNFTKKLIHDNIITLIVMGSSKISTVLNFVVFMFANFPKIQDKVYKELTEIYGVETPTSAPIKYNDLQRMHYLDRVIKETMRLFPPVPIIDRKLTEDMKISEYTLPKNSNIIIPFISIYRNEKYWPNALKFDPDRFLPERIKDRRSHYFTPFGDGPRNCIGTRYAMTCIKVILATLIRTFVFKTDESIEIENIELNMGMTLSTIEPLKIRIEKRHL